jgi:hypothetical protein
MVMDEVVGTHSDQDLCHLAIVLSCPWIRKNVAISGDCPATLKNGS